MASGDDSFAETVPPGSTTEESSYETCRPSRRQREARAGEPVGNPHQPDGIDFDLLSGQEPEIQDFHTNASSFWSDKIFFVQAEGRGKNLEIGP